MTIPRLPACPNCGKNDQWIHQIMRSPELEDRVQCRGCRMAFGEAEWLTAARLTDQFDEQQRSKVAYLSKMTATTPAGRFEQIIQAAQIGAISQDLARELIEANDPTCGPVHRPLGPQLIGGLTAEQCLERYERIQREDASIIRGHGVSGSWQFLPVELSLAPDQLAAAKELWSRRLRAKVEATAKPTRTIMVDAEDD